MKTIYILYFISSSSSTKISILFPSRLSHNELYTVGKYQLCKHQSMWSCWQCCLQAQVLGPGQWPCWSLPEPFPHPPQKDSWRCVALQTALSPRRTDTGQSIKSHARQFLLHCEARLYFKYHIAFCPILCFPFHIFLGDCKHFWVPCVVQ